MTHADWYADASLWDEQFDLMFPETSFERAVTQVDRLVELALIETGRVLDMPCGPGRHSIPLARRGFEVTGVDLTQPILDRARQSAEEEGLDVEWVLADMRTFTRPEAFDIALNAFTSLGYFREWDENVQVLRNVYESLKPGGVFAVELMGKEGLATIFTPVSVMDLEDGRVRIERRRIVDSWRRIENEWILLENDKVVRRWRVDHWLYSAGELIDMLTGVGFSTVDTYHGWSDRPYDHTAKRLMAVARKP